MLVLLLLLLPPPKNPYIQLIAVPKRAGPRALAAGVPRGPSPLLSNGEEREEREEKETGEEEKKRRGERRE